MLVGVGAVGGVQRVEADEHAVVSGWAGAGSPERQFEPMFGWYEICRR
jgi:hypothetical protein